MPKILNESHNLTYEKLNQERIHLVDVMRHSALRRLDKNTIRDIDKGIDSYHANQEDERYFTELALQDPLVVNSGYEQAVFASRFKEILIDHTYSNNADYRITHQMFMGTREGFELSQNIASVLFQMMVSDEYSQYCQHLVSESNERQDASSSAQLEQVVDRLLQVRESNEMCRKYNLLVDARRSRTVESTINDPLLFAHEDGDMIFLPTRLYREKMSGDGLDYESMGKLRMYLIHDDNAFCKLSRSKRYAKNICNGLREEFEQDVRQKLVTDVSFAHIQDMLLQKVS